MRIKTSLSIPTKESKSGLFSEMTSFLLDLFVLLDILTSIVEKRVVDGDTIVVLTGDQHTENITKFFADKVSEVNIFEKKSTSGRIHQGASTKLTTRPKLHKPLPLRTSPTLQRR